MIRQSRPPYVDPQARYVRTRPHRPVGPALVAAGALIIVAAAIVLLVWAVASMSPSRPGGPVVTPVTYGPPSA